MSSNYGKKLRSIRKAEQLTQAAMSSITGVALSAIKNYETQGVDVGLSIIERVLAIPQFQKYTLWLMTNNTAPESGQIAPPLSLDGPETTPTSRRSTRKIG
ncbi:helix-turn-helix domain-containing protein [Yersinia enterocolitica]|uniref:helix-turn-helix domain-containing protein n=1 Tax=Yersinia enterocolitica TaxID=630 RepID=UPI00398CDB24